MLGVPFAERGRRTDEAIDAITAALTDEWPEHTGEHWSFKDVGQRPRPVQQPRPPIWIGGSGKPALRRVAARGDGWIPQGTPAPAACPTTSRTSCATATKCAPARCRRSASSPRRCTSASPTSTSASTRCRVAAAARRLVQRARRDRHQPPAAAVRESIRVRALRPGRARSAPKSARTSPASRSRSHTKGSPMPLLTMRQDFRAPAFGPASTRDIYRAALEQMKWADAHGFDFLVLSEHHGIDDGWMPAPLTMAASILAMTDRCADPVVGLDPPVARPDPHRRADRGDRQRVPGPAVDRARRRLPRRRVRDGRGRPRAARQDPRGTDRGDVAGVDRRAVRVARAHRARHTHSPRPNRTRRCSSAAECPPRRGAPRASGSR